MTRIFIGAGWPYANGPMHIGHFAGAFLPSDAFARYHRLRGNEVLFVSGSDMHGTPILVTAETRGATPEAIAREFDEVNRRALHDLGVSLDLFTHTHTVVHERTVQELFLALLEHGFIGRRTEANAYCPRHRRFLPDRYVVGECPHCHSPTARGDECDRCGRLLEPKQLLGPKCRLDGAPAEFRDSEHFYLLLDKLSPKVEEYLAAHPEWRANVVGVTRNFLAGGLHPTPITRDLDWGVPIPLEGYPSKRFYVWFDAVIGYLSASREWAVRAGRPDAWRRYWDPTEPVRPYYFVGKDNIFFHTVFWPAILLGAGGFHLPQDVPASEWMQIGGQKLSKSRPQDADVFLPSLLAHYPPDVIRFYAGLLAPQNHDTDFNWDEFHQLADEVLSNQYGNLAQRILALVRDRAGGHIPPPPEGWSPESAGGIGDRLRLAHAEIAREFEAVRLKEALDRALVEVREANRRFHEAKPWQAGDADRARALYEGLWTLKALAVWLSPFLPFSSEALWRMLGYPFAPEPGNWDEAVEPPEPGQALGEVRPLFPRLEARGGGAAAPDAPSDPRAPPAATGPRPPLAVRVGTIREVENHPSADKLYLLRVDDGDPKPRTLVAGLRPYYTPDELRGRRVTLLANLAPRTIRKLTSQGMVLAADVGERAVLLEPPAETPTGTFVLGTGASSPTIAFEDFARTPLVVGRIVAPAANGSRVEVGGRTVEVPGTWTPDARLIVRLDGPEAPTAEVLEFPDHRPLAAPADAPPGTRVR